MDALHFGPPGFHTVTPTVLVDNPAGLVRFMTEAFAAEQVTSTVAADGSLRHAIVRLGDSFVEVEVAKQRGSRSATLHPYVEDARSTCERALKSGAKVLYPVTDMPYGDREAGVEDHWGNSGVGTGD